MPTANSPGRDERIRVAASVIESAKLRRGTLYFKFSPHSFCRFQRVQRKYAGIPLTIRARHPMASEGLVKSGSAKIRTARITKTAGTMGYPQVRYGRNGLGSLRRSRKMPAVT